ncbi:MAG TPA: nitroreductase family protein [Candidatus Brocadiia bacterium]|nr:nitroreductase family protein [Candidatus Brocadiia bacterium]
MDALEAIKTRHSTRIFTDRKIPKDVLEKIIDAGGRAPTARNEQPWAFVVVTDPATVKKIGETTDHGKFISQASACVCVFCRDTKYYLEDGCAATENILLAAAALGVQSCWVAGDKKDYCADIARLLGVPPDQKLISLLALGYAKSPEGPKAKRPTSETLRWEKW